MKDEKARKRINRLAESHGEVINTLLDERGDQFARDHALSIQFTNLSVAAERIAEILARETDDDDLDMD